MQSPVPGGSHYSMDQQRTKQELHTNKYMIILVSPLSYPAETCSTSYPLLPHSISIYPNPYSVFRVMDNLCSNSNATVRGHKHFLAAIVIQSIIDSILKLDLSRGRRCSAISAHWAKRHWLEAGELVIGHA